MKRFNPLLFPAIACFAMLCILPPLGTQAYAQGKQAADPVSEQANKLEAELARSLHTSPKGASILSQLVDLYHENGRVFGLVRAGRDFIQAQPDHPNHAAVMLKLIDGLKAASMSDDIISTSRQFTERHPKHAKAYDVQRDLAKLLLRSSKKNDEIARAYHRAWELSGKKDAEHGWQALEKYEATGNKKNFQAGAELAEEMLGSLPKGHMAAQVGLKGLHLFRRYSDHAGSNRIGLALLKKGTPLTDYEKSDVLYSMGENFRSMSQHNNSLHNYLQAAKLSLKSSDRNRSDEMHRKLIQAYSDAGTKASQWDGVVQDYLKTFKTDHHKWWAQTMLATAYARDKDVNKAIAIANQVIPHYAGHANLSGNYVTWTAGEENKSIANTEKGLITALKTNRKDSFRLRYQLGIDVYANRMKDPKKASATLFELLEKSPTSDYAAKAAIHWLLSEHKDDNRFDPALARIKTSIQKAGRPMPKLVDYLQEWGKGKSGDKERRHQAGKATKLAQELRNSTEVKNWRVAGDRRKGRDARKALLKGALSPNDTFYLLDAEARGLMELKKPASWAESLKSFKHMATIKPTDYSTAYSWLETVASYDAEKGATKEAVEHMLKQVQHSNEHNSWIRALRCAKRIEDKDLAKRTVNWINETQKRLGLSMAYAREIAAELKATGLEAESTAYLESHKAVDLNSDGSRAVNQQLAKETEDPAKRKSIFEAALKSPSDQHGAYAADLAEIAFRAGDYKGFESLLTNARKEQDSRTPRKWSMGEYPAMGWLDHIRKTKEMEDDQKQSLLKVIADSSIYRVSDLARVAQLELPSAQERPLIERMVELHGATLQADRGTGSWDRFWPFAQHFANPKQWPETASLVSAMMANIPSVDDNRRKNAQDLVGRAYSRMGSLGLDIASDSPIAPLMEIGLYLRLNDDERARKAYFKNQILFEKHKNELPVELVLFGANTHILGGGDENHNQAENILRAWLIANGDKESIAARDKAKVQLLLGRNYFKSGRFDVARNEYNTVKNSYAETPEATEAEFGIGESYMAQKVFDKAEEIFTDLSRSRVTETAIRAEFLRGVLANRRGDRDEARVIFRNVLERVPDVELANETLYNLAEVYGVEQRYMDQLDLLRTVGRLGQQSKRYHAPGKALSIVVQDSDLGISRGNTRIPVTINTEPGGDSERAWLTSGGAGKGLFIAEIDTELGEANPGDGTLQVIGSDTITVDYPNDFKEQFQYQLLADNKIEIAADAELDAASRRVIKKDVESFTSNLKRENDAAAMLMDSRRSVERPENQIKPGNPIYIRVEDSDRDLGDDMDRVAIKVIATSGDQVQAELLETSPHSGIFEGIVATGELPAGALASDSAIDHRPLLAIDQDKDSYWQSEPDGASPKWLSVDMKDLHAVNEMKIHTPVEERGLPIHSHLQGSYDGRFFFTVANHPPLETIEIPFPSEAMTQRVYFPLRKPITSLNEALDLIRKQEPASSTEVQELLWSYEGEDKAKQSKASALVLWHGKLVQRLPGCVRMQVRGQQAAILLNGKLIQPFQRNAKPIDAFLKAGLHDLTIIATTANPKSGLLGQIAHENKHSEKVVMRDFRNADLDLTASDVADLQTKDPQIETATVSSTNATMTFSFADTELRYLKLVVNEYYGESIQINHIEINGPEEIKVIPTEADVVSLAVNDKLELTAGDAAEITYIDDITEGGLQKNRQLNQKLTATYYNGKIEPIAYAFLRGMDGEVESIRKDLMRIDAGDRIGIEITDYDLDESEEADRLQVEVILRDQLLQLEAVETERNSGVFRTEVDTTSTNIENQLTVAPGDQVLIRYLDTQNTFPGHSMHREGVVFVNEPTDAQVYVLETRYDYRKKRPGVRRNTMRRPSFSRPLVDEDTGRAISGVTYQLPLTVEVLDPDAAKDSMSSVEVDIEIDGRTNRVICSISTDFGTPTTAPAEMTQWALYEGRFIGQIPLQLGGADSPEKIPYTSEIAMGMRRLRLEGRQNAIGEVDLLIPVANVTGGNIIKTHYADKLHLDATESNAVTRSAQARLRTDGSLSITTPDYERDIEKVHVGEKLYVKVTDPDLDSTDERDTVSITIRTTAGEEETLVMEETLSHSGVFTGGFPLKGQTKPTPGNAGNASEIECFFGTTVTVHYVDNAPSSSLTNLAYQVSVPVAVGTDGKVSAFSKLFGEEELAIQTQFHIAESYFELFKGHLKLERKEEADMELEAGRRILKELVADYPDPKYLPRIAYLQGQFAQELKDWNEAITAYETITRNYADHTLAADAQYKLAQCYEEADRLDDALEAYVTLASTYPESPLIASVMIRINEHFYRGKNYEISAQVGKKFIERFPTHEFAAKMAFRVGQSFYKEGQLAEEANLSGQKNYIEAAENFDIFTKKFPDEKLCSEALFWAGESYRMAKNVPFAFRRYNRCRWDFPESDAAKYSRGRLALPEMIAQFEKEANLEDE